MRGRTIVVVMAAIMAISLAMHSVQAALPASVAMTGSLLVQSGNAFAAGITEGTALVAGEGPLRLATKAEGYLQRGVYLSPVIQTAPFKELILSWNADTPAGTALTVEAQVLVGGKWSEWFSWGTWGAKPSSAASRASQLAKMDIDTLTIKGDKKAAAVRYRLTLTSNDPKATPAVRLVALAIRDGNNIKRQAPAAETAGWERNLSVPAYSQGKRDPRIASRICSPTSVSMVMAYLGMAATPEEAAWGSYDHRGDLFGNWSFNAAYAGKRGLTSYVAYLNSVADLKQEIAQGYPVVAAVWYRSSEAVQQAFPILHGAPVDYTGGHLVVVRGFKVKDGKEYVLVNDPAGSDDAAVYREYPASEFEAAWVKVAYIIRPAMKN